MLLRDPVHGLVTFRGREGALVEALLATHEVQRLRRVRQLGLASFVYPGAEHSRFAHALGAAHVMVRLLDRLEERGAAEVDEPARVEAVAAALLHDLGHGPYSHLFEEAIPDARHHEEWTRDLILDEGSEVHVALERFAAGTASRVADMLAGRHRITFLPRLVSGPFDVDRADYLLRDSHATGVRYGLFDLDFLLESLRVVPHAGNFVLALEGRKGLPPIESFFVARYAMYQQVYHHKAVRAAESVVRAMFRRYAELAREGDCFEGVPSAFRRWALGEMLSPHEYASLDDPALQRVVDGFVVHPDATLSRLGSAFRERRLPKTVPLPEDDPTVHASAFARAADLAREAGFAPEYSVWLDVAHDTAYEEPEDDVNVLYVVRKHRPLARLGDVSFLLRTLKNQRFSRPRLVFDAVLAERIRPALDAILG